MRFTAQVPRQPGAAEVAAQPAAPVDEERRDHHTLPERRGGEEP